MLAQTPLAQYSRNKRCSHKCGSHKSREPSWNWFNFFSWNSQPSIHPSIHPSIRALTPPCTWQQNHAETRRRSITKADRDCSTTYAFASMHRKRISKEKYIDVTLTKSLKNLKDRTDADLFGLVDLILRPFSKKVDRKKERKLCNRSK